MNKIGEMIQETEQKIRELQDRGREIDMQVAQLQQEHQMLARQYNDSQARLVALKEVEAAGSDLFHDSADQPEGAAGDTTADVVNRNDADDTPTEA